jgi:hypothetical protein
MPVGNLHCFGCGLDLQPPVLDSGSVLVQLYPAVTQAVAFAFYRLEVVHLAAAGWHPIAHTWGDERIGGGTAAVVAGDAAPSLPAGTPLVTYRQESHA